MTAESAVVLAASEPTPWDDLAVRAPLLAATMRRYLAQQTVTLAPSTILAMNNTMVRFGLWVIEHDPTVRAARDIGRPHIEAFKLKCITDVHFATGKPLATNTIRQRLRLMKVFFDRIIDWEFDDAPGRNPIIHGDVPPRPEPLPKFFDDDAMTAFMHHAETEPDPLRRLCVLLLARTGMRVGELCNLAPDPVVEIGDHHSLHVPVGQLRNDRYVPLHPTFVELIVDWQTNNAVHIARTGRLLTDDVSNVDRPRVWSMKTTTQHRATLHNNERSGTSPASSKRHSSSPSRTTTSNSSKHPEPTSPTRSTRRDYRHNAGSRAGMRRPSPVLMCVACWASDDERHIHSCFPIVTRSPAHSIQAGAGASVI
jgi:integrase